GLGGSKPRPTISAAGLLALPERQLLRNRTLPLLQDRCVEIVRPDDEARHVEAVAHRSDRAAQLRFVDSGNIAHSFSPLLTPMRKLTLEPPLGRRIEATRPSGSTHTALFQSGPGWARRECRLDRPIDSPVSLGDLPASDSAALSLSAGSGSHRTHPCR